MARIELHKQVGKLHKTYSLPTSKSVSNRLLVLQFLYQSPVNILNLSTAHDTTLLQSVLKRPLPSVIDAQDAGTVMRYMTAVACTAEHPVELIGTPRMHQRPIAGLVEALRGAGAEIEYLQSDGFPPIKVLSAALVGDDWQVDASVSSQYVTALAMLMPYMQQDMQLTLRAPVVSRPYITMTTQLMQELGMHIELDGDILVYRHTEYKKIEAYTVPSDYSSLAFPVLELATRDGVIKVAKTSAPDGLQGDERVLDFLPYFGITAEWVGSDLELHKDRFEVNLSKDLPIFDFTDIPDLALPMISALSIHHETVRVQGIQNLNHKESERWEILQDILFALGCKVFAKDGHFLIRKVQKPFDVLDLDDQNDHRVVMTMASLSSLFDKTVIYHPEAVQKSYPEFWKQFEV